MPVLVNIRHLKFLKELCTRLHWPTTLENNITWHNASMSEASQTFYLVPPNDSGGVGVGGPSQ